jgi:hypothetical protein
VLLFRARFIAFLAALLLLPAGAFAQTQYFCRSMDRVMDDCCCKTGVTGAAATEGAQLQRGECCQLLRPGLHDGPPATQVRTTAVPPLPLLAVLPEAVPAPLRPKREKPVRERAIWSWSPILGPPVYLKHCVLLT